MTAMAFHPPTIDEVSAYARQIGYSLDVERFVSFYDMVGWRVGARVMKDWRAAVRYWRTRDKQSQPMPRRESASLGALQMELAAVQGELHELLYPGGSAFKARIEGEKLKRAEFLSERRMALKRRIESFDL